MYKLNFIHILISAILASHCANVEGLDMDKLKTAFENFFDSLKGIIESEGPIPTLNNVRVTYNTCANQATTYDALAECGQSLYSAYSAYIETDTFVQRQTIIALRNTFVRAIVNATIGDPADKRVIPFQEFKELANNAATENALARSDRQERI